MAKDLTVPLGPEDHTKGSRDASVSLVEYADFQCPDCAYAYPITKQVQLYFGDDLLFAIRHFPLDIHRYARMAAESAEWAGSHNRFWQMHDLLFVNQDGLSPELLLKLANTLSLSPEDLADALENGRFTSRVTRDIESGVASGVHGTPTFFVNGKQHTGSYDFQDLVDAIELARQRSQRRAG